MSRLDGKKLLVLGNNAGSENIVTYARSNGAYVYVADYYPKERSSAKRLADEALLVSTADLDALEALIRDKNIDGVLAGVSEFNLLAAMSLCERCGLPFYCTRKQWDQIECKDQFRNLCKYYGVPSPATYYCGSSTSEVNWNLVEYPVVLKPVDSSSSAGVHFCQNKNEVLNWWGDSLSYSTVGKVILEKFCNGSEFTAHFVVCEGRAKLACIDNRYPVSVHAGAVTTVPVARIYPSFFTEAFEQQVTRPICSLCEGIGLINAVMFVQGLYDEATHQFSIFEGGMRSAGEVPSRFLSYVNGLNYLGLLVDNALSVKSDYEPELEDPYLKGHCDGVVSFVGRGGKVGAIEGLEEAVACCHNVLDYECRYQVGSTVPEGDTLRQIMVRFILDCDSREQMAQDIAFLNEAVSVQDECGHEMVIKMDPERVFGVE